MMSAARIPVLPLTFTLIFILIPLASTGCSDGCVSEADEQTEDGGLDRPDSALLEASVPDSSRADAMPDSAWCGDFDYPGPDPNGQELPPTGQHDMAGASHHGHLVVYADSRLAGNNITDVFVFDLENWVESRITASVNLPEMSPFVHQNEMIWVDLRHNSLLPDDYSTELYHYDVPAQLETRLTHSQEGKTWPVFNQHFIVFRNYPNAQNWAELKLVDRQTWDSTVLCQQGLGPEGYDLGQRYVSWVAWQPENLEHNKDVYYFDLQTGNTVRLMSTLNGMQLHTSVDGERIVWMDDRNGAWDVYMYDVGLQQETNLSPTMFDQVFPVISGDLVVFRDYSFTHGRERAGCASDLFVLDLSTMIGRRITTVPWFWAPVSPISDGKLLASDANSWRYKLYIFDLIDMGVLDASGQHVLP